VAGVADQLVTDAVERVGPLRGMAITTGLGIRGQTDLLRGTDADWQATFDDVLLATVRACRAVVPHLIDVGGGSIVTTAAYSIHAPKAHQFPYATLKAGVATLTKDIAKSFGPQGVRANCVCPGATETEFLAAFRTSLADERGWPVEEALERAMVEDWGMQVALGRPGRPDELGDVIAFLLSNRSAYVTGALINVDGGTDF
jgi:NAD(P)-dependent dehydrogenase (short-subunit alcohol dehydrogenase family)